MMLLHSKSNSKSKANAPSCSKLIIVSLILVLLTACRNSVEERWSLTDIQGHLPDLNFSLISDERQPVTARVYRDKIALVYFGYTYCPDVCPETLTRLKQVIEKLKSDAKDVRILFITVDPARDTPEKLHHYVRAFDKQHVVGLTGTQKQVETLAKRYRIAYQSDAPDTEGNYQVTHSSAVYIFDKQGRARLMATNTDSVDAITHDLRLLLNVPSNIKVHSAWVRWLPSDLPAAGYMTIENQSKKSIDLISASSPNYARVMLHQTVTSEGKISKMVSVDRLTIPAHGQTDLAPGNYHLMLEQATHKISPGSKIKVDLKFSDGEVVSAIMPVRSPINAL